MNLLYDKWVLTTGGHEVGLLDAIDSTGVAGVAHGWSVLRLLIAEAQKTLTPANNKEHKDGYADFRGRLLSALTADPASWEMDRRLMSQRAAGLKHDIPISMLTSDRASGSSAVVFSSQEPVSTSSAEEAARALAIMPIFGACAKTSDTSKVPRTGTAVGYAQLFLQGSTVWETVYLNLWTEEEIAGGARYCDVRDLVSYIYRPVHDVHYDGKLFTLSEKSYAEPPEALREPFTLLVKGKGAKNASKLFYANPAPVSSYWESLGALTAQVGAHEGSHLAACLSRARRVMVGKSFEVRSVGLTCGKSAAKYALGLGHGYVDSTMTYRPARAATLSFTRASEAIQRIEKAKVRVWVCTKVYAEALYNAGKPFKGKPQPHVSRLYKRSSEVFLSRLTALLSMELPYLYDFGSYAGASDLEVIESLGVKLRVTVEDTISEVCRRSSSRELMAYAIASRFFSKEQ